MFAEETVTYLALVAESHPALFALITKNPRNGRIESVNFVSEDHFRAVSQKAGRPDAEITSKIFDAKQTPGWVLRVCTSDGSKTARESNAV